MKIRNIDFGERPVALAPMEDVTDPSFRLICSELGADMVTTEFVSADALVRDVPSTLRKLEISDAERPAAIQIYGREPGPMAEAARIAAEAKPDWIDINFGCPVKKVAGKGAGAGLLRDIPKMLDITRAVVDAVALPVTVKTRLGWDHESKIIVELAEMLQDCGIEALTVHGRTRSQLYNGDADWDMIAKVKENQRLRIPVIGNGDISSGADALKAFEHSGVDAIMVGRASIGNPWIFSEIKQTLVSGSYTPLSITEKFNILRRQINESISRVDPYRGILHIRRHLATSGLFKGIPNFREKRIELLRADTPDKLLDLIHQIEHMLTSSPCAE